MKIIYYCWLFLVFFGVNLTVALAEVPQQLKSDFSPLSGTIIMSVGDEYLIDRDATSGLREGDILTLVKPGKAVAHPETNKVLGYLDQVQGYLQVTQIKSGYSYATVVRTSQKPRKGDEFIRYEQVPALLTNQTSKTTTEKELMLALPHLHWLKDDSTVVPILSFQLDQEQLSVRDYQGAVLRSYPYADGQLNAPTTTIAENDTISPRVSTLNNKDQKFLDRTVGTLLDTVGLGGKDKRLEKPSIVSKQMADSGIWMGPVLKGNPTGLVVDDFDQDGQQEVAVTLENRLKILRYDGDVLALVAEIEFSGSLTLLSLDSIDTNGDSYPELIVSAHIGNRISSQVVQFQQGQYQTTISNIPWLLRVVDLPGEGPTLLGQRQSLSGSGKTAWLMFRCMRKGDTLLRGEPASIPLGTDIFSVTSIDNTEEPLLAGIAANDKLVVATLGGTLLWKSENNYGGSETGFTVHEGNNFEDEKKFFVQKKLLKLPDGKILVPQNKGTRLFEIYRDFNQSSLVAMTWDGFALQESWRTSPQGGYLADFDYADADNDGQKEVVMVINFKRDNLIQDGRSTIVFYELDN